MKGPLTHQPLAVCSAKSIDTNDIIPSALYGLTPSGLPTSQMSLKYNPNHEWFYFPHMTNDEVLVFKQFECIKGIHDQPDNKEYNAAFHTAFKDP